MLENLPKVNFTPRSYSWIIFSESKSIARTIIKNVIYTILKVIVEVYLRFS